MVQLTKGVLNHSLLYGFIIWIQACVIDFIILLFLEYWKNVPYYNDKYDEKDVTGSVFVV